MKNAKYFLAGIVVVILLIFSVTIFWVGGDTNAAEEKQESASSIVVTNRISNKERLTEQLRKAAIALEPKLADARSGRDKAVLL